MTARKAFFEDRSFFLTDFSALSSAQSIEGRIAVTPTITLLGDLPTAYAARDFTPAVPDPTSDVRSSDVVLGNPYVGAEVALPSPRGRASVGVGVRLPVLGTLVELGDDISAFVYGQTVSVDRPLAYAPDTFGLVGTAEGSIALSPEVLLVGRLAPQVAIRTDGREFNDDVEVFLSYTFRAEVVAGSALLSSGIRATGLLTEEMNAEMDRFDTTIGFAAEAEAGTVRPGVFLEFPVSGATDALLEAIAGVGLSVDLN